LNVSAQAAPAASAGPDGIKLHIGGWAKREGWVILDPLPGPVVDYVGSCTDLSFLPDASCAEVYASHVLEHLGYDSELPKALVGIHRVLKSGGRLRAAVPDLEMLCRLFLEPSFTGDDRFHIMRMMFGGRTTAYDVHYAGLNFEFLQAFLHETALGEADGEVTQTQTVSLHGRRLRHRLQLPTPMI
jgi:predicted SAM-dependent methyltransferase